MRSSGSICRNFSSHKRRDKGDGNCAKKGSVFDMLKFIFLVILYSSLVSLFFFLMWQS